MILHVFAGEAKQNMFFQRTTTYFTNNPQKNKQSKQVLSFPRVHGDPEGEGGGVEGEGANFLQASQASHQ